MEPMTDPNPASWHVISQVQEEQFDNAGNTTEGFVVTFRTGRGNVGSVFVPAVDYDPDTVRGLIAQRAAAMNAVSELTGTVGQ